MSTKDVRQKRHAGVDGRYKTIEPEPERDVLRAPGGALQASGGAIAEQGGIPVRQSGAVSLGRRVAWTWVGLAAVKRVVGNRPFEATVITGVLVLAGLPKGRPAKEMVRGIKRLIAWNDRRTAELEKKSRQRGKA